MIGFTELIFSYGIRSFDTSAYYGPSEIVLGTALKALRNEFPRSSYKLVCYKK
jgi:D-arabinose 1-dehydrogenase